ncbi:hypothetical protein A1Q2_05635 [Trichosporon asahii var. asahii CBS 8904]|uniref:Uncharacterized protein n=1 Tax=Trichosporon asahii var. asahii (strain CBS 8904) TaxID=1220162 RepID=K1VTL9_TRIAC|nr:hypothetical protein A1Q2_05635 [Trichosporon asahii var. asahii CBS 8904]
MPTFHQVGPDGVWFNRNETVEVPSAKLIGRASRYGLQISSTDHQTRPQGRELPGANQALLDPRMAMLLHGPQNEETCYSVAWTRLDAGMPDRSYRPSPLARANLAASIRWALLSTSKDRSVPLFTRRHDTSEASHDFDRRLAGHGMCDAADALRSQLVLARTRYVGLLLLVPGDNRAPLLLLYQTPPPSALS